jgi:Bifunctional DNA primase/polymerase, N-terminal
VSGIDVLDVDVRGRGSRIQEGQGNSPVPHEGEEVDGFATLAALGVLPETLAATTPHSGRHYFFRHIEGSRNRKVGEGLEWFATGKLVVVPPAAGRAWLNSAPIAEAPEWLRQLVLAPSHTHRGQGNSSGPPVSDAGADPQVPKPVYLKVLRLMPKASPRAQRRARALYNLLAGKCRERNDALNFVAYQFRELIAARAIEAEGACELLVMASRANGYFAKDGEEAVRMTIMSGLGMSEWPEEERAA